MVYSFVPAILSFTCAHFLLFTSPLNIPTIIYGFSGLMVTQLVTMMIDLRCVERDMAPKWFLRFRSLTFSMYMLITAALLLIYYSKRDFIQRKNDKNRIEHIKTALELEDSDFIKMVNELKLDYDEDDLREADKEITTGLKRIVAAEDAAQ